MNSVYRAMQEGAIRCTNNARMAVGGKPIEVDVYLTKDADKQLQKEIVDMMNTSFIIDSSTGGIDITTDKVEFKTFNWANLFLFRVLSNTSKSNSVKIGDKTICIDSL